MSNVYQKMDGLFTSKDPLMASAK